MMIQCIVNRDRVLGLFGIAASSTILLMRRVSMLLGFLVCSFAIMQEATALDAVPMAKTSFLDLKDDARQAAREGKTLMLMFEQEGCVYCIKMRRVNFADKEIVETINEKFYLVQIDIWGDREVLDFSGKITTEKEFARELNVQLTPMTVFFSAGGSELLRMTGYYKPPLYKAALHYVMNKGYESTSFREYVNKNVVEVTDGKRRDEPFYLLTDNISEAFKDAKANGKGIAMLFEQKECLACVELHAKTFANLAAVKMLTDTYDVIPLDIWGGKSLHWVDGSPTTETAIAARMNIQYTPTMVFFDRHGVEIFRYESYREAEHFQLLLQYLTTNAYTQYRSFQDWLRATHDAQS